MARHQSQCGSDSELRERLKQLAAEYPRYGYELLHGMLKAEGLVVNEKKTYRIYREEKLQVRRKRRKRLLARDRVRMPMPEGTDHPREVIEADLAHVVRNRVEAAYARSDLFERRRMLMDDWARYLAEGAGEDLEPLE